MSADILQRLIEAGTPAALVAEVAMALGRAAGDRDALAERRERDAQRQRSKREREKVSRDVTVRHGTSGDIADIDPAPNKSPPDPQKLTPTPHGGDAPACETPASAERSLNRIIAGWLGLMLVTTDRQRKRWRGMPPPTGVSEVQWRGFLDHRKAKRNTLTPRAFELLTGKLAKHSDPQWPPGRIIDTIVERGWLSFDRAWLDKISDQENGNRSYHQRPSDGPRNPMVRAVLDAQAERAARGEQDLGNGWGTAGAGR